MVDNLTFKPIHLDGKELLNDTPGDNQANFRYVRHFINNSSETIHILHRNNLSVPLRKTLDTNYPNGDLIIRSSWQFHGMNMLADARKSLIATFENLQLKSPELIMINKRLIEACNSNPYAPRVTIVIDRIISARRIKEMGSIYLHDEDIIISSTEEANRILHPYSSEGTTDPSYYDYITKNNLNGFFIELIDNEKNTSSRFIYSGKKLLEIQAVVDSKRKSGVYYQHAINHPLTGVELERNYCTLDDAEVVVGLFKTRDEALSGGNPEIISKTEFEESKKELARANHELELVRNESNLTKEKLDRERLERADLYEERKIRRNDYYDDRSYARKDSNEILKLASAAVGAGLAVFGVMTTYQNRKGKR